MNITSAIDSVEKHGKPLEKARLNDNLYETIPNATVLLPFLQLQNTDGGFPFGLMPGRLSMVDTTLTALWWLDELGMLNSVTADLTLEYLITAQKEDGGWDEDPAVSQYELPPWITPGDLRSRLYLSAYAAFWLAVRDGQKLPAFQKALSFLLKGQESSGRLYGYLHSTWIGASALFMAEERYRSAADRCVMALMKIPFSEWADSQIAWALDCLSHANLEANHLFIAQGLEALYRRQGADGSWASEDGEAFSVSATIQVIRVLKHYGMVSL